MSGGGVLSFTLGLNAQNFISNLGIASGELLSFAAIAEGIKTTFEKVWGAIEQGGTLFDLATKAGESAGNVFQLGEAFKQVGADGGVVTPMLLKLQKALGGLDENGNKTDEIFAGLGLSMDDLKAMNAPQQIENITAALRRLSKSQQTEVASRIFGREGAGAILQATRDVEGFRQGLTDSAGAAKVIDRTAAIFDKVSDTVTTIKGKLSGFWAGVAEGAAPFLQNILDVVNSIDFVGLGQKFGSIFGIVAKAFKDGNLATLVFDAIMAGFNAVINVAPALFAKLGVILLKALQTPLVYFRSALDFIFQNLFAQIGKIPGVGKAMGLEGSKPQSFDTIKANNQDVFGKGIDGMNEVIQKGLEEDAKVSMQMLKDFYNKYNTGDSSAPAETKPAELPSLDLSGILNKEQKQKVEKPEVTALEKLGFVFGNGGPGATTDHAKNTEENTRRTNALLERTNTLLARQSSATFQHAS